MSLASAPFVAPPEPRASITRRWGRWAFLVALWGAGCGESVGPSAPADPCAEAPPPLALGASVSGALDADTDCFERDARLGDRYLLTLATPTLFDVTLATVGYLPFVPTYLGEDQLSGWASDSAYSLTREHLFPPGSYVVRASSFAQAGTAEAAPQGPYTLSTAPVAVPQEGCGRETSITYGSTAEGRLTPDDCRRAPADEPDRPEPADGYAAILAPGRDMVVTATADFAFRLLHLADGAPADASPWLPAGAEASLTATGAGFHDFYVVAESADSLGAYLVRFVEGGGAPPAPPATTAARSRRRALGISLRAPSGVAAPRPRIAPR